MIEKIKAYVEKYHMIEAGDCVVAGVSGGADSVCLLLALRELQAAIGVSFSIKAVHIEHGVRGADSRRDAEFTAALCERLEIPFTQAAFAVPQIAEEWGISVEEAGRILRYRVFAEEAAKEQAGKIAVAHNQNDNAETMLHHLIRGSGLQGITGIPPVRDNIIRPLLGVSRAEIEQYLAEHRQEYCTDATNFSGVYTRNRIRGEVMPVLSELNPKAMLHMTQTADMLREIRGYLDTQVDTLEHEAVVYRDKTAVLTAAVLKAGNVPEVLLSMLIHRILGRIAGSGRDIAEIHVKMVAHLLNKQVGKRVVLPAAMAAERVYEGICIRKEQPQHSRQMCGMLNENPDFTCHILERTPEDKEILKKKYTKWLDYDKIKDNLCVRNREPGDYFYLEAAGHSKRLKQYFVDEKIPREIRGQIPLVADGAHIVWVVGYRLSAYYKVSQNTRRILEIKYNGGKEDE